MTSGLTFLSLMSAYWWKNYILNFETYKLDFKGHFGKKELQNLSVTKIYSVGFNHDALFDADHDAEILCKRIKQSDWPWKFLGCRVFHYIRVGVVLPPSVKKWPNLRPSEPTKNLEILTVIAHFCWSLPICKISNLLLLSLWTRPTTSTIMIESVTSIASLPHTKN